jgi:hypothetical protein
VRRILSISLLIVLVISIFPWEALELCPNKNGHHGQDEMHHGNCADGMMGGHKSDGYSDSEHKDEMQARFRFQGPSCTAVAPAVDSYNANSGFHAPSLQQVAILAVLFEWLSNNSFYQKEFYPAPEFLNKSGPPATVNPLRGPPIFS